MPIVEVKVFEDRFNDPDFVPRMVAAITAAVSEVMGPEIGSDSTVLVKGVRRDRWGHGGQVLG
jgi:phenylpyruvate tautomerase PptA (4-oxalocrotonate tautomerase family)